MQLDDQKQELKPDEQEKNLSNFKDNTSRFNSILIVFSIIILSILIGHFTVILNAKSNTLNDVPNFIQTLQDDQHMNKPRLSGQVSFLDITDHVSLMGQSINPKNIQQLGDQLNDESLDDDSSLFGVELQGQSYLQHKHIKKSSEDKLENEKEAQQLQEAELEKELYYEQQIESMRDPQAEQQSIQSQPIQFDLQSEQQAEQQPEQQPEQQAEQQPEQQAEQQPEEQAEQQAEQQPEQQAEQQPEQQAEQQAEQEPEQQAEQQPEQQPEQEPEQQPEQQSDPKQNVQHGSRKLINYPEPVPNQIIKPQIDKKDYRYLELPNKLKVLIIHDSNSLKAEAALNVHAGSWDEPSEFPGLAHFLEHMLFQGSVTYPESGYFQSLVAGAGGNTNAYTQSSKTNYYFSTASEQLFDAMQVFAHFFIDPLLSESMVEKEVNAVNSEYEIDVSGDGWKFVHLLSMLSGEQHPMSRFSIGNIDTLMKEDIVKNLRDFHDRTYSSNLMALVVKSSKPLDEMEQWLMTSDFTKIENKNLIQPDYKPFGFPIPPQNLASIVKYHINGHSKTLLFVYQLDDNEKYYKVKPLEFIISMVNSRHQDSLYSYLTERGLATSIDTGTFGDGNGSFNFYLIEVELPSQDNSQQQALVIAQAITAYFNRMMQLFFEPVDNNDVKSSALLEEMWGEHQMLGDIEFRFLEDSSSNKNSDIFHLSHNLNTYKPEEILSADYLYQDYDGLVIYNYLMELLNPGNMIILIASDQYEYAEVSQEAVEDTAFIDDKNLNRKNVLYRIDWDFKTITQQSMDFIAEAITTKNVEVEENQETVTQTTSESYKSLKLPQTNSYIPEDLEMKSFCTTQHEIESLIQTSSMSDPYQYLPQGESESLDDPKYQERLDSFVQVSNVYYTSKEDCLLHERSYEQDNAFPHLIKRDLQGKAWWKLDRSYEMPAVYGGLKFDTAIELKSIKQQSMSQLYKEYVQSTLKEEMQQAFDAGYKISFDSTTKGVSLEMFGWSDKFEIFFRDVLKTLKGTATSETSSSHLQRLERAKTNLIMQNQNAYEKKLFQQALTTFLPMIMIKDQFSPQQFTTQIQELQFEDISQFRDKIYENFRFTTMFAGNILREDADYLVHTIYGVFQETTHNIQTDNYQTKIINLHGKAITIPLISRSTDKQDLNGATLNYYQIGSRDSKQFAIMNLLQSSFNNQAFDYLRTDLQLGYVVSAKFKTLGCIDGVTIIVQGTSQLPYLVNQHIETFLQRYGDQLGSLSDDQFQSMKDGAISKLKESIKSLEDDGKFMWDHIKSNDLAFEEKQVAAQIIQQISKEEVVAFYNQVFHDEQKTGKISIQIYGQGMLSKNGIENFNEYLMDKQIPNGYAEQTEIITFDEEYFAKSTPQYHNCQYKITNV